MRGECAGYYPLTGCNGRFCPHQPPAGGSFSLRAKSRLRRLRFDTRLRAQPRGGSLRDAKKRTLSRPLFSVCQKTSSSSCATTVRGFKNPKIFPKSLQAKAFPRPVCKLFQIHGSKFKPHPLRNAGQASHVGIAHRVFFFGICKDTLNRFLTFFVNALTQICFNKIKGFPLGAAPAGACRSATAGGGS